MSGELERLASACLFPGFAGLTPPDWIRRRLVDGLGGVVLYARNVDSSEQLTALTAALRAERDDVLVAIDEEGGDVTRLEASNGSSYPGSAALGAVDDVELTERVAEAMGADLAAVGVNLDFAPVADVNTNPGNPIIGIRSFGTDPDLVARHVAAFVRGLQSTGVAACAKHFPGHGDTSTDSHLELPTVAVGRETLVVRELVPFRAAIDAGVQSIMTAHILLPALDEVPATTSRAVLTDLLRSELGFEGMVMTDALEMRAISATVGVEEGAVRALQAGADALCLGHDRGDEAVASITRAVVEAVRSGRLPEVRLGEAASRVRRVAAWTEQTAAGKHVDRAVGALAARRALRSEGEIALDGPALIVELTAPPSIAAGHSVGPGEWLRQALPGSQLVGLPAEASVGDIPESDRLVIVVRDPHRHAWQRVAVDGLLAVRRDVVVVEVGLPHWRPSAAAGYIATYGAARVSLEAAAEVLAGGAILGAATRGGAVR
jgi:beta-N-acetylhexosaminidase